MLLLENSLYTNDQEKNDFLSDHTQVMNSLITNYFGFIGLLKLGFKRGQLKKYSAEELRVRVNSVTDDNQDPSLLVKLALDAKLIRRDVADQMTRLLAAIKMKTIAKGSDIDEARIRDLASLIRVDTNRPSPKVYSVFKEFVDGNSSLGQFTRDIYKATKEKDSKKYTMWFRERVNSGQFLAIFAKIPATTSVTSSPIKDTTNIVNADADPTGADVNTLDDAVLCDIFIDNNNNSFIRLDKISASDIEFAESWIQSHYRSINTNIKDILDRGSDSPYWKEFAKVSAEFANRVIIGMSSLQLMKWLSERAKDPIGLASEIEKIPGFGQIVREMNADTARLSPNVWRNTQTMFQELEKELALHFWSGLDAAVEKDTQTPIDAYITLEKNLLIKHPVDTALKELNKRSIFLLAVGKSLNDQYPGVDIQDIMKNTFGDALISASKRLGGFDVSVDHSKLSDTASEIIKATVKFRLSSYFTVLSSDGQSYGNDPNETNKAIEILRVGFDDRKFIFITDAERALVNVDLSKVSVEKIAEFLHGRGTEFLRYIYEDINAGAKGELVDLVIAATKLLISKGKIDLPTLFPYYYLRTSFSKALTPTIDDYLSKNFDNLVVTKDTDGSSLLFTGMLGIRGNVSKAVSDRLSLHDDFFVKWGSKLMKALVDGKIDNPKSLEYFYFHLLRMKNKGLFKDKIIMGDNTVYQRTKHTVLTTRTTANNFVKEFVGVALTPGLKAKIIAHMSSRKLRMKASEFMVLQEDVTTDAVVEKYKSYLEDMDIGSSPREAVKYNSILTKAHSDFIRSKSNDEKFKAKHLFEFIDNAILDPEDKNDPKKILEDADVSETIGMCASAPIYMSKLAGKFSDLVDKTPDLVTDKALTNIVGAAINFDVKKLNKDSKPAFNELRDTVLSLYIDKMDESPAVADKLYEGMPKESQQLIVRQVKQLSFFKKSIEVIMEDSCPIKPRKSLDPKGIKEILKKNSVRPGNERIRKGETISEFKKRLSSSVPVEPLHIAEFSMTDDELLRKSVEYDMLNNGKHGNIAVKLLKEFDVNLPNQLKGQSEFEKNNPDSLIYDMLFHGCGSVAASFIMRYGYAVFTAGDSSVVKVTGKMLGDGIYVSPVITKSIQYATDKGMLPSERCIGEHGYLLIQRVVLGKKGEDYVAAGIGADNIRSPEYVLFRPNEQARIHKAYETLVIHGDEMAELKKKFSINEDKPLKLLSFKDFLTEEQKTTGGELKRANYIFKDGFVPVSKDKFVQYDELSDDFFSDHIYMDYTPYGPMLVFEYEGVEDEVYFIDYISQILRSEDDMDRYFKIMKAARKQVPLEKV